VSEGFAFPYGLCPLCGEGKLEAIEQRSIASAAEHQAIRIAFEIELGGMGFYTRAAAQAEDALPRELFEKMARMEGEHIATLSRRYHVDLPAASSEFRIDRAAIYAGIDNKPEDPSNLFRIAIAFEERAVKFFEGAGAKAASGSPERLLYKELAAEEREHVALLTTEFARFREGKAGIL